MIRLACQVADKGADYDLGALFGFTLSNLEQRGAEPNSLKDPREYFCSELLAWLLMETAHLRTEPPPEALMLTLPTGQHYLELEYY